MVNNRVKGHKAENELANKLKKLGYQVQVAQRTTVFTGKFYVSKDNDFFNLFDLLAINNNTIELIQVKSNASNVYTVMPKIKNFADELDNNNMTYVVALRVARKGWVNWVYHNYDWTKQFFDLKLEPCSPFVYS